MYNEEVLAPDRSSTLLKEHDAPSLFLDIDSPILRQRCLVVDDNPLIMHLVAEMMVELDYQVDMAADGLEALGAMSTSCFDLVLTDLEMPYLSGYHLASQAKHTFPDTNVIIMTGQCRYDVADLMSTGPADAWLFKPFDLKDLYRVLDHLKCRV